MDQFTFSSVLTACGGLLAPEEGKQIHAYIMPLWVVLLQM
jgi:hypothetical protein